MAGLSGVYVKRPDRKHLRGAAFGYHFGDHFGATFGYHFGAHFGGLCRAFYGTLHCRNEAAFFHIRNCRISESARPARVNSVPKPAIQVMRSFSMSAAVITVTTGTR